MLRHKLEELERLTQRGKLFRDLRRAAAVFLDRPERLVVLLLEGCHSFCSKLSIRACVRLIIIVVRIIAVVTIVAIISIIFGRRPLRGNTLRTSGARIPRPRRNSSNHFCP